MVPAHLNQALEIPAGRSSSVPVIALTSHQWVAVSTSGVDYRSNPPFVDRSWLPARLKIQDDLIAERSKSIRFGAASPSGSRDQGDASSSFSGPKDACGGPGLPCMVRTADLGDNWSWHSVKYTLP